MEETNKRRKETFGWWGALSAIRGDAWLTSTQMHLSTTKHATLYSNDGTKTQCAQEQQMKTWTDKTMNWFISHVEDGIYSCL